MLAGTGAFNLYAAAAQRQPVPLTGGLDLVPDLMFGELDDRPPEGPEVIVVPQVHGATGPAATLGVQFLRRDRSSS